MKKYLFITLLILLFSLFGCDKECNHNFKATDVFPNTCEIDGYTLYRCTECSYTYKGDVKHAPGHVTEITKEGYPATCTESGLTNETSCKVCKQIISSQEKISILGHNYDVWVEVSKPTKTENGLLRRICKTDETHIEEHTLAKLSSESYQYVLTAPTCIALGLETFDYEIDGQKFHYEVVLEKTNHPYVSVVTAPTCEAGGYTTYTCSYCFDTYVSDYVDALGHDYQGVVTDPTCEAKGYTTYICQNDNSHQYVDDYVDALGHQYVTYNYNNDATCEEDGTETATCSNGCGKTDTKVKANTAIGHDYQSVVIDPACEAKGYTVYTCKNDNSHQYIDNYIDALGHRYLTYNYNNDATCEEDGTKTASCANGCGKTDTLNATNTALGHSFTNYRDNNDATCKENGTETAKCDRCSETNERVKADSALGHADADGDFYCDRCGIPYGNDITMIDSYDDLLLIKQNPAGFFQLTADINLTNQTWDSNFTFYGYLYGDGFTISGLTGSFIEYNNGTIDSLNISGTNISLSYKKEEKDTSITLGKKLELSYNVSTSVFATHNNNTIKNCNIKGAVKFEISTYIDYRGAASTECESIANIYFGGFAAENAGTINNCQIQGVIEVTSSNYAYHDITSYFTIYNGEYNTSKQNLFFGGFAAINKGNITNCKSTGFISTYFNVTADYDDAYSSADGRANAYTTAYLGLIAAKNESKITNVSVNNVPVVNKVDVQNSALKETGVVGDKTGKEIILSINTLSDYQYLIGENSGTISEVVTKY